LETFVLNLLRTADGWQTELPLTDEEAAQASEFAAAWSLLDQDAHRKLLPHVLEQVTFDAPGEAISITLDEEALCRIREFEDGRATG
jgi:hypothetical protein